MEAHREALYGILDQDTVLFGEWLVAKHSVSYDLLPDYFLAFDLYDKRTRTFLGRSVLEERLAGTNIPLVRVIHDGLVDRALLDLLLEQRSGYSTTEKIEGLYLKCFDEHGHVSRRAKVARPDFAADIQQHWSSRELVKNRLAH
jgi:atypical dual specificity phosphatase